MLMWPALRMKRRWPSRSGACAGASEEGLLPVAMTRSPAWVAGRRWMMAPAR